MRLQETLGRLIQFVQSNSVGRHQKYWLIISLIESKVEFPTKGDYMNIQNNIGKYLLGVIAGISLVVGCGGSSGVNNAGAAGFSGVTAQLFCIGWPEVMSGQQTAATQGASYVLTCMSSASATKQIFQDFYQITQQGWILVESSSNNSAGSSYIFQK